MTFHAWSPHGLVKKFFMNVKKCVHKDNSFQREDGHEVKVEEKTIQVVHTHTKVQTLYYNSLHDVFLEVSIDCLSRNWLQDKGMFM